MCFSEGSCRVRPLTAQETHEHDATKMVIFMLALGLFMPACSPTQLLWPDGHADAAGDAPPAYGYTRSPDGYP